MNLTSTLTYLATSQPSVWFVLGWILFGLSVTVAVFFLIVIGLSAYNVWHINRQAWTEWRSSKIPAIQYQPPGAVCGPGGCVDYPETFTLVERQMRTNTKTGKVQRRNLVIRPISREEAERLKYPII